MALVGARKYTMDGTPFYKRYAKCEELTKLQVFLLYLSIITLLFMGNNVLHAVGWNIDYTFAPTYQKLRPEFYILLCLFASVRKKISDLEVKVCLFSCFVFIYWLLTGQSSGFAVLINTICLPAMLSCVLRKTNERQRHNIYIIVLLFFLINSILALFERFFEIKVFAYYSVGEVSVETVESFEFRSTALRNHPLCNAFLTAIIISFVVISEKLKATSKFLISMLGFWAILAFNARSSILIVGGVTFLYFLYNFFIRRVSNISRWQISIFVILSVFVVFYLFGQGWGGRLLVKDNLSDTSVEARLLIYQAFLSQDFSMFLFGMSNEDISRWAKLEHIESYWILYLSRFGIFIFLAYIAMFYKMLKRWISGYHIVNAIYVALVFLAVSSTNNSLYNGDPGIATFILCAAAFYKHK